MLTLVVDMRPKSWQMQLMGQEMAIELAHFSFVPVVTPGVANKVADILSRRNQPGQAVQRIAFLSSSRQVQVLIRNKTYYLTGSCVPEYTG